MVAYDLDFRLTAAEMLKPIAQGGFGQEVTLTAPETEGTYDPATDTTSGATPGATHDGSGVEEKYSTLSRATGAVEAGDVKFLLSALKTDGSVMPQPVADSWTLTRDDGVWTIKRVDPISPAGTDVYFELQIHR